jgi:hypothetical protein
MKKAEVHRATFRPRGVSSTARSFPDSVIDG